MHLNPSFRILMILVLTCGPAPHALAQDDNTVGQAVFRAGSQTSFDGPAEHFSGDVRVKLLFPSNDTAQYSGAYVTFQPGARTAWHLHPAGQHMIIISGVGLTGTRDGRVIETRPGDAVWCPPNRDHWHGATPDAPMAHLVITGSLNGKNVVWKEKVADSEYFRSARDSGSPQ